MNSPLPIELIDHVFTRLTLTYGQAFLRQYEGVELGPVKTDWALKLAPFGVIGSDNLVYVPAIDWALEHLTDTRPPNALAFRELCRAYRTPVVNAPRLPFEPRPRPDKVNKALARLAEPREDTRPEKVRVACRFIAKWGTEGVKLNPRQQADLAFYRRIAADWEAQERARADREARQALEASHAG